MLGCLFDAESDYSLDSFDTSDVSRKSESSFAGHLGGHRSNAWTSSYSSRATGVTNNKKLPKPPSNPRPSSGYVGLLNQGATCYLNSFIQALYMTPEFRTSILGLTPDELGLVLNENGIPIKEEVKTEEQEKEEKQESKFKSLATELANMGFSYKKALNAVRQFPNDRDSEAIDKAVEWLCAHLDDGDDDGNDEAPEVTQPKPAEKARKVRKILVELQNLFARLLLEDSHGVSTNSLTNSFGWNSTITVQQHDVHELSRVLFDAVERSLRGTKGESLVNDLYRGIVVDRLTCLKCETRREREEYFSDVSLIVTGLNSVVSSLQKYVTKEILNGNNQYFCSACNEKVDAEKGYLFKKLPPYLILSLLRFEYDWETETRTKNCSNIHFPLELDMTPFCDGSKTDDTVSVYETLFEPTVDSRSPKENVYQLFGVIIHRGKTAQYGHYHAYIRDFSKEDDGIGYWYDFDDSGVKEIDPLSDLPRQFGGPSECAYMLLYRKKSLEIPRSNLEIQTYLTQEINKLNEQLRQERQEYDKLANQIEVILKLQEAFTIVDSDGNPYNDGVLYGLSDASNAISSGLIVDQRSSIDELKQKIIDTFNEQSPPFELIHLAILRRMYHNMKNDLEAFRIEKIIDCANPELKIQDTGFTDGCIVLAWDGRFINGIPFDFNSFSLGLSIRHFSSSKTSLDSSSYDVIEKEHIIQVPEHATLSDLRKKIEALTNIPPENQLVVHWRYKQLIILKESEKTMIELGLSDGAMVSVEYIEKKEEPAPQTQPNTTEEGDNKQLKPPPPPPPKPTGFNINKRGVDDKTLTYKRFQERLKQMEVYISDEYRKGKKTSNTYTMHFGSERTLEDVKREILKLILNLKDVPEDVLKSAILRKAFWGGKSGGSYLFEESMTLKESGIEDGTRIIIEPYENCKDVNSSNISLRFLYGKGEKAISEMLYVTNITRSASLFSCKTAMLARLKEELSEELLPFDDPNEFRIRKTDWQSDPLPQIISDEKASLFVLNIKDDDLLWIERGKVPAKGEIKLEVVLFLGRNEGDHSVFASPNIRALTTTYNSQLAATPETVEQQCATHQRYYQYIADVVSNTNSKLIDLKQQILQLPDFAGLSTNQIRLWMKERLLKKDNLTLKKQHISANTVITVQKVPEQKEHSEESVLLYIGKRLAETNSFEAPFELFFDGNDVHQLKQAIAAAIDIPVRALSIAKYLAHNNSWKLLDEDEPKEKKEDNEINAGETESKVKKEAKSTATQRLFNRLHIRDGEPTLDYIVARDLRDPLSAQDDFIEASLPKAGQKKVDFDIMEDDSKSAQKRPRVIEVGLKIEMEDF